MRPFAAALVLAAALAGGCARAPVVVGPAPPAPTRDDLYVLVPGARDRPGELTVTHGGQEIVLGRPWEAVRITGPGPQQRETRVLSPDEVQRLFGPALAAQPARPVSFTLYFVLGTDELTPESRRVAETIFAEIARRPAPEVVAIGHTDRVGTIEFNDRLSLQRAEVVRNELVRLGLSAERIRVEGRGEREPAVPTEDEVAEPRNRRVEIIVR